MNSKKKFFIFFLNLKKNDEKETQIYTSSTSSTSSVFSYNIQNSLE